MKKTFMFIVCFAFLAGITDPASAVILDEVADLDLTNVVKAVHWSNNSTFGTPAVDTTISGVTFLAGPHNGTVDGVTNAGNAFGAGDDWQLDPTTDDAGLNDILNSFLIGNDGSTITIPVANGYYKLQLLFYDPFVDTGRGIDVTIEGVLVFNDYFQAVEQGGDALSGSLLTYVFTVADGQVDILFDDPKNAGNYLLSGLILSKANIASKPGPSNGKTMVVVEKVLSWDAPGAYTPSGYDVYLDTDETKVATGSGKCEYTSSNQPGTTFDPSADLSYSTIYYWRVDAIEGDTTTHQGDIWSFTTGGKATNPSPADKDTYITVPTVDLSWTGDTWATSYKVYAGSSFPLDYLDEVTEPEYPDFPTDGVTTYYWRIDEYVGASPTIDGDVWEFTTRESISCPEGDLDASCRVDLLDLVMLCEEWLAPAGRPADIVGNNGVDLADFGIMANNWMKGGQWAVVINEIHYNPDLKIELVEFVELYNPMPLDLDISGWHFCDGITYEFPPGTILPAKGYVVITEDSTLRAISPTTSVEAKYGIPSNLIYGPFVGSLSNDGEKIELCNAQGQEVDQVDYTLGFPWPTVGDEVAADGDGHSIQLASPMLDNDLGGSWRSAYPTPAADNSEIYADNIPPHIRQVKHTPQEPVSSDVVTITAKVTDPDGVAAVTLYYQMVDPGSYIPIKFLNLTDNPAYEDAANWTNLTMNDDGTGGDVIAGDDIYTVQMSAGLQTHRRLIRYRISVEDDTAESIVVPYADDPQPNFAYFVYDGVPAWNGAIKPGDTGALGEVVEYGTEVMRSLPVYHLIATESDVLACQYNGDYNNKVYRFAGTLIYGGKVYDHIHFRVRGENSTYVSGKNKWKFRFNRGHWFQGRDNFGEKYDTLAKTLNLAPMSTPWCPQNRGMAGLDEAISFKLFNLVGVPGCNTNAFQLRVIDSALEASPSDQYEGDLWGFYLALEQPDGKYLDEHDLPDGNLYKMAGADLPNNQLSRILSQGTTQVTDMSDLWDFISDSIGYDKDPVQPLSWWQQNVNLSAYYSYRTIVETVNHTDIMDQHNCLYYHHPETGKWWMLPWDLDSIYTEYDFWGPDGVNRAWPSEPFRKVLEHEEANIDFKNRGRELQDLLLNPNQLWQLIDEYVEIIAPSYLAHSMVDVDRAMWDYHPRTGRVGTFYKTPFPASEIGSNVPNYQRVLSSADFTGMLEFVKDFTVAGGFGGDQLSVLTADPNIPNTPSVAYTGSAGFPENDLTFQTTAFSDPQGAGTFAAMKWRIAEVEPFSAPSTPPSGGGMVALIAADSEWKYFKGIQEPSNPTSAWRQTSFDDGNWLFGDTPIGYGPTVTTELTDMRNNYTSVYLRKEFQVNNHSDIETLRFSLDYDEGFNIWINGTHLDSVNVSGAEVPYDDTAPGYVPGQTSTVLTYSNPAFLVSGTNVIAIQLLNNTIGSSDILFGPVLEADLIENPGDPGGYDFVYTGKPGKYEIEAVWESQEITPYSSTIRIPADGVKPGKTYRVRCKIKDDTGRWSHWSDPNQFVAGEAINADILDYLRVSEVMYNNGSADFIELKNTGTTTLNLSDVSITDGVAFSFAGSSVTSLAPGDFVMVVKDQAAFEAQYGTGVSSKIAGTFVDSSLSNGGETVKVEDCWNGTIVEFEYNDGRGWPIAADGAGHSLIPLALAMEDQPLGTLDYGANWRQSSYIGGSPGTEDSTTPASTAVINEFMAHTDYQIEPHESNDWIELYNAGTSTVNLDGNWYLSDDSDNLKKYALPTAALSSGGTISYDQVNHFNPDGTGPSGWGLNKAGDTIFLSYLPGTSADRVVDCMKFKGQANTISLSRIPDGGSYWFHTDPNTRDGANGNPVDRVVISEIMYHPLEDTATETYDEYIELYNPTGSSVNMWTVTGPWALDGEVDYTFPALTMLNSGDRIIVVDFDPSDSVRLAAFESGYGTATLTAGVDVFGPWSGDLSNNGGRVTLEKPQDSDDPANPQDISWIIVDECIYNDCWPWVTNPDGLGSALRRISSASTTSGNDPDNWNDEGTPTPGG